MENLTKNRALEDTRNREVMGRLAIPESKSSGVFILERGLKFIKKPFTRPLRFNENRRLGLKHTKGKGL